MWLCLVMKEDMFGELLRRLVLLGFVIRKRSGWSWGILVIRISHCRISHWKTPLLEMRVKTALGTERFESGVEVVKLDGLKDVICFLDARSRNGTHNNNEIYKSNYLFQ